VNHVDVKVKAEGYAGAETVAEEGGKPWREKKHISWTT
jgi:hypothetical protein